MILLNNIYAIKQSSVNLPQARFAIRLLGDSPIYKAHFPGMPITPGVCIIEMAVEMLSLAVDKHLRLTGVKNAKFITALTPDVDEIEVSINKISIEDSAVSAKVEIIGRDSTVYAKISLQADIA